jgi:uncharacterized membrane protein
MKMQHKLCYHVASDWNKACVIFKWPFWQEGTLPKLLYIIIIIIIIIVVIIIVIIMYSSFAPYGA